MRILFVAAEAAPVAKIGGMGDVVGALPQTLRRMGHDVRLLLPYYGTLPEKLDIPAEPVWQGEAMSQKFDIFETVLPGSDVPLYLFGHVAFAPKQVYGGDEGWRFTLFGCGAVQFCRQYWTPQVVHAHDWHAGAVPVWLQEDKKIATVFTIHNLAYQGMSTARIKEIAPAPASLQGETAMAAAIHAADRVNTVSPTYAKQIQTPEYGEGLDELLVSIGDKLVGIVNGLDLDLYDPAKDVKIYQTFSAEMLDRRSFNKTSLQKDSGLQVNPDVFLLGMVSRLVEQKGLDLILQVLDLFLAYTPAQFVVLGTGNRAYESALWEIAGRFPGRMSVQMMYNDGLSRRIYAASDAFLMPSRFEPCGIGQMMAMRYGCVPIVRRTGGLVDTVEHHNPMKGTGTGYCFDRYEPFDLYTCMVRASEAFNYKAEWQALQKRCLGRDFSWTQSAQKYADLYREIAKVADSDLA